MPGKVILRVVKGPMAGKEMLFEEHDTFLFGRAPECHVSLPDDSFVSRFHFVLEVNPPQVRLRDLGSLNGTFVGGMRCGTGDENAAADREDRAAFPEVDLHHGDKIQVGKTIFEIAIATTDQTCRLVRCGVCGQEVFGPPELDGEGTARCGNCRAKQEADVPHRARKSRDIFDAKTVIPAADACNIPGYCIERILGQGGMGIVYLARRMLDDAHVALKVLTTQMRVDEMARNIFVREAETLRQLSHRNIVGFMESGSHDGALYVVMEYCNRGSLKELMASHGGAVPIELGLAILRQSLKGLEHAHERNFVHRDIKPQNILLHGAKRNWRAKLADFGLAKSLGKAGLSGMTATGAYGGSVNYMPREQVTDFKYVRPASDVWSMAATFYDAVTGQPPRTVEAGQDPLAVLLQSEVAPIRKRLPDLSKSVAEVIDTALATNVNERYPSAGAFRAALKKAL